MKLSHFSLVVTALIALASSTARTASATYLIYDDSFSRPAVGTQALNGTSPDVVNTGGASWAAAAGITTDGTQANDPPNSSAFLPFIPAANNIYTLSADMNITDTSTANWEALGFSATNAPSGAFFIGNSVAPWIIHPGNGGDTSFMGPGTTGITALPGAPTGYQNYAIVLNTETPLWTVSFYRNGILEVGPTAYSTNPTINFVGFGDTANPGLVDNFTLTALPEPSSVVLFGLAAVGLLCAAWRRRRAN